MNKNLSLLIKTLILCGIAAGCGTPQLVYESPSPTSSTTEISFQQAGSFRPIFYIATNQVTDKACKRTTWIGNNKTVVVPINKPLIIDGSVMLRYASKMTNCGPIRKIFTPQNGITYSVWMEMTEKTCTMKIHVTDKNKLISEVEGEIAPNCQSAQLSKP